ncbi:MAG: YihY/virulence factor BrkB family protein [Alphaproteobacteria bacterium]|nr:YihY/virulence factor BrkB family protein [Alphaproteobacteria bacterium]MDE2110962.1 YihY/virulence factor BrkB family protein [Alphaproteobacteria bacterium]MDE2493647.1 YihY/virulence factor BrkB family protein [Alphaproteobacteria bacterium]
MGKLAEYGALLKDGVVAFVRDRALSRGAAIAFYALTAAAPILYFATLLAGLVLGGNVARGELVAEIGRAVGYGTAAELGAALRSIGQGFRGFWPAVVGTMVLVLTAGGVFVEVQAALNAIWKLPPPKMSAWRFLRSWAESLALVLALGVLLLASLLINAVIGALGDHVDHFLGMGRWFAWLLNLAVSSVLVAFLIGAIYKLLPNRELHWRDVAFGAAITALLFQIGEFVIGWYIAVTAVAHRYGPAAGLIVASIWMYYSAQVFLLGAELTKVWSWRHGDGVVRPSGAIVNTSSVRVKAKDAPGGG